MQQTSYQRLLAERRDFLKAAGLPEEVQSQLSAEAVEALRVFREGVAEAERLSEAETPTRQVSAHAGIIPGRGRLEPGERYDQRILSRPMMPRAGDVGMRRPQSWQQIPKATVPKRPGRSRKRLIAGCLGPFLVLAGVAHWQRERFSAAFVTDFVFPTSINPLRRSRRAWAASVKPHSQASRPTTRPLPPGPTDSLPSVRCSMRRIPQTQQASAMSAA